MGEKWEAAYDVFGEFGEQMIGLSWLIVLVGGDIEWSTSISYLVG